MRRRLNPIANPKVTIRTAARALGTALNSSFRPIPIPPSQPSCSRWLTCSCCRSAKFFSPNEKQKSAPKQKVLVRPPLFLADPAPSRTEDVPPSNPKSNAHFLPLPPPLPYSPTSHPFKRHLEILSLSAISSTPEESWRIYLSLHPSLRQYIPDDLFRSFLAHQLSEPSLSARWVRSEALIEFGQKCGMELSTLGMPVVSGALHAGLVYAINANGKDLGMTNLLESLWATAIRLSRNNMGQLDLETRRRWLEFHLLGIRKYYRQRQQRGRKGLEFLRRNPAEVVKEAVEVKAHEGVEDLLEAMLLARVGRGEAARKAVEVAIWCLQKGVEMSDATLDQLFLRLVVDDRKGAATVVLDACSELPESMVLRVQAVFTKARELGVSRSERAVALLSQFPPAPVDTLLQAGLALIASRRRSPDLDLAVNICERLHSTRNSGAEELYHAVSAKLEEASRLPLPPISTIIRFSSTLSQASTDLAFLRNILISTIRLDTPEAYTAARTIYPAVRTGGFLWTPDTLPNGRNLFHQAVDTENRHTHFASRLYADLIADGQRPYRQDMLALIRTVCMSHTASRPILLERYLRDFVDFLPQHRGALVRTLVSGLVHNKHPNDALLAWTLIKRLDFESELIPAKKIVACLASSSQNIHRQAMLEIVAAQSSFLETLPDLYDIILTSFSKLASNDPDRGFSTSEALVQAGGVFRDMASKNLFLTIKAATALVRGLVEANELDQVLALVKTVGEAGIRVKSLAVGRLIVKLAMVERYEDAEEIERVWRGTLARNDVYDRGVVGARALMDIKRGKKVDMEQLRERTGWVGNKPFLAFMRSLQEDRVEEKEVQSDDVSAVDAEVEDEDEHEPVVDRVREGEGVEERHALGNGASLAGLRYGGFVPGFNYIAV